MPSGEGLNRFFETQLTRLASQHQLRTLRSDHSGIDFFSNDYLGLAQSATLFDSIEKELQKRGLQQSGATGSRLLSGNSLLIEETEAFLAELFDGEAALIFNSGYAANQGVLSCLPQRNDTILYDELAHACMKDGARLSMAKRFSFRHNDLNDLEAKIKRSTGRVFVAVESVYSMDGDLCPLGELVLICEKYGANVILDEAHSTGCFGEQGNGIACMQKLSSRIPIRIYTFGKAMGIHGACVVGSKKLIEYLVNFSRSFIYTTALPPHSIISIRKAFDHLKQNPSLQTDLAKCIMHFTKEAKGVFPHINESPIQTMMIEGNERVRVASSLLKKNGLEVRPILSPTVKAGRERLRICLHAFNTTHEIGQLVSQLKSVF